jgi:hypothetical protein
MMYRNIKFALQDPIVFDYFKALLSKAKKSRGHVSSSAGSSEGGNAAAEGGSASSASSSAAINKATIEEVEKALEAAISGTDYQANIPAGEDEATGETVDGENAEVATAVKKPAGMDVIRIF